MKLTRREIVEQIEELCAQLPHAPEHRNNGSSQEKPKRNASAGQLKGLIKHRIYMQRRLDGQISGIRSRLREMGEGGWLREWDEHQKRISG